MGDKEEGKMSEIKFREIIKDDLQDVFLLLNQLKEKDVNSIDLESAWKNFKSNSSSNSIVGTYDDRVVAYGSIIIENKITKTGILCPEILGQNKQNYEFVLDYLKERGIRINHN